MKFGIGQPMRRHEDLRFITGRGRYTDDVIIPRMTHAFVLRSPVAHAHIKRIDTAAARRMPGVLFVATGEDVRADGLGDVPCMVPLVNRDGTGQLRLAMLHSVPVLNQSITSTRYRSGCVAKAGCKRVSACRKMPLPIEAGATRTHCLAREPRRARGPLSKVARRRWARVRFRGRPHTLLVGARREFSQRQWRNHSRASDAQQRCHPLRLSGG